MSEQLITDQAEVMLLSSDEFESYSYDVIPLARPGSQEPTGERVTCDSCGFVSAPLPGCEACGYPLR